MDKQNGPIPDNRIVYGATCLWWGSIREVDKHPENNLPCCPHCKGMLFETPEPDWWTEIEYHDMEYPGYRDFILWLRGKCIPMDRRPIETAFSMFKMLSAELSPPIDIGTKIWGCKIGECQPGDLVPGADAPMREAVAKAYKELTGLEPNFIFSGWHKPLTQGERAVVNNKDSE